MANTHTVKSGESLGAIAKQHNVTVADILAANPDITNPNLIRLGQVIQIPTAQSGGAAAAISNEPAPAAAASTSSAGSNLANAILDQFESSGASAKTAKQDKLPGGVGSSEKMADFDRKRVMAHKHKFILAANQFSLPPALLAAIASRESRGGAVLKNGFGDGGHGFGLMQVDNRNPFKVQQDGGPAGQPHINQATGILANKLAAVKKQFAGLSEVEQLQMAVSRYNGGAGKQPPNSDAGTTGGDYMNDVWARARFYARVEDWS
jgi:LysM domain-containing protein/transglycosylase-like protein with SLT domain